MVRRPAALLGALLAARGAAAAPALGSVTDELAKALGAVPAGSLVVASPLASDVPATKPDELAARVAGVLAGKLPGPARPHAQPLALALAHGAAKGKPALVFVRLEIARGELRATADAIPVVPNAWDRARLPPPPPMAHAFASAPIDAEVRAALTPIPLEQATVHRAKHDEGEVLAAACGDVDGDGQPEIALVSQARVAIGRLRQGRFAVDRSAAWTSLAKRLPAPLREPIAGAWVPRGGGLVAATSDFGGVALDGALRPRAAASGVPVGQGMCAALDPAASAMSGPFAPCLGAGARVAAPARRYDAASYAEIAGASGGTTTVAAVREAGGKLIVEAGGVRRTFEDAGAQVAAADLDLDGAPEVAVSSNAAEDELAVRSLDGAVRLRFPAAAGIRALCACPPEERGVPAVVAVVGDEVWLVR